VITVFGWFKKSKGPAFPSTDRVYATRQAKLAAIRAACLDSQQPCLLVCPFEDEISELCQLLAEAAAARGLRLARVDDRGGLGQFVDQAAAGSRSIGLVSGEVVVSEATMATAHVRAALAILVAERHPLRSRDDTVLSFAAECPPSTSVTYFCSLEDGLFERFGGSRVLEVVRRLGMPENEAIEHPWVSKSIEDAQRKVAQRVRGEVPARSCSEWLQSNLG
jgi:hypothetical protein